MYPIISRNIHLFRDQQHLSYMELSNRILNQCQIYISPIQLKEYESGQAISAQDLFFIALALRVDVAELFEESPILQLD